MAVSLAQLHGLVLECFDIASALLQGLRFTEIAARAKDLGIDVGIVRKFGSRPPATVWLHFRENQASTFRADDCDVGYFVLR